MVLLLVSALFVTLALTGWVEKTFAKNGLLPSSVPASFSPLVKAVSPSVVNIITVKTIKEKQFSPQMPFGGQTPFDDFFKHFFGDQIPRQYRQKGLGTGFVIDKDGYILTNYHVVNDADEIRVKLPDNREFDATVIGRDSKTDLALIQIASKESLPPLPLGDSDQLEVGDWVIAIGNPFGLGNTVTSGIVSAKFRQIGAGPYDNFIQTDASINPGNSGGPLLNTNGEVVGINSAIFSQSGGNIGIGFAIPINMAKELLPQLKKGKVIRGWLGVLIQKITPELKETLRLKTEAGALVADVTRGGPADEAGIMRGDVITSFDGKKIHDSSDLPFIVASTPVGKKVEVELIRNGKSKTLKVTIEELGEEKGAEMAGEAEHDLGMTVEEITPEIARYFRLSETNGLVVTRVLNGSPAADSGFAPGDMILEIDQKPVKSLSKFNRILSSYKAGNTILFLVKRADATLYLTLQVP